MLSKDREVLKEYIEDLHTRGERFYKAGQEREANQVYKIAAELQQMVKQ